MGSKVERFVEFVAKDMASQTEIKQGIGWDGYVVFHFIPFGGVELTLIENFYSKYDPYYGLYKIYNDEFYSELKSKVNVEIRQSHIIVTIGSLMRYIKETYGLTENDKDIINSIWATFFNILMSVYG